MLKSFNKIFICAAALGLVGCSLSFSSLEYRRGLNALDAGRYAEATKHFKRVMLRAPDTELAIKSAREAARLALFETKKFSEAAEFYGYIVRFSHDERERREAQKSIANIYLQKTNDYARAIEEYNKLLLLRNSNDEIAEYRFNLARAHFALNHFYEAQSEIDEALKVAEDPPQKFELRMFLANIYFNTKRVDAAIKIYEGLSKEFPERAETENVAMNIVVCYEEQEAFDAAIDRLEKMRRTYHDQDFIDLKIKRLRERKANLPGSRGLRK